MKELNHISLERSTYIKLLELKTELFKKHREPITFSQVVQNLLETRSPGGTTNAKRISGKT